MLSSARAEFGTCKWPRKLDRYLVISLILSCQVFNIPRLGNGRSGIASAIARLAVDTALMCNNKFQWHDACDSITVVYEPQ